MSGGRDPEIFRSFSFFTLSQPPNTIIKWLIVTLTLFSTTIRSFKLCKNTRNVGPLFKLHHIFLSKNNYSQLPPVPGLMLPQSRNEWGYPMMFNHWGRGEGSTKENFKQIETKQHFFLINWKKHFALRLQNKFQANLGMRPYLQQKDSSSKQAISPYQNRSLLVGHTLTTDIWGLEKWIWTF